MFCLTSCWCNILSTGAGVVVQSNRLVYWILNYKSPISDLKAEVYTENLIVGNISR